MSGQKTITIVEQEHFGRRVKVFEDLPENLFEVFKTSIQKFPHREAVIWGDQRVTYSELYEMVNALASNLQNKFQCKKGDRIAIIANNRTEYCVVTFAAFALGCILVPLNSRLHPEELQFMLSDAAVSVLFVEDCLWETSQKALELAGTKVSQVVIGQFEKDKYVDAHHYEDMLKEQPPCVPSKVHCEDPAFIMYTSGTTGTPKGVIGTHLGIVQNIRNFQSILQTTHEDRTLISVPLFHVSGFVADFLHMMLTGGAAVLMYTFKTQHFLELLECEKITYLVTVPTIYTFLLNFPGHEKYDLSHWRIAAYGGAPMPDQIIREMLRQYPGIQMVNTYGATECSGSCTFMKGARALDKPNSVGLFEDVVEWKIVNELGEELPQGEVGELWLKGPTVTPGYWRNESATKNSFSSEYWKSGDIGYVDEEGFFFLLDRKKDSINRGGEKIFCVELEDVLYNHPDILEAAVVGVPDQFFGEEILAVVVPKEGKTISEEEIRAFLEQHLADYKVPRYIRLADSLPRNPGGKVVKKALRSLVN
ncbi:class I adenylate-forming enzyme family protein [Alicyclobacillus dauci]|uniref:Acyl--CoA ligase n=1 Tax=Alicyclobacillus dauci TaxID=1475485 RepID=A0ABY6Z1M3_9BACL|nr:class I adenylate-forming enzyme family protein [Alicyclobacillus dauci]WAH36209.1 acyl--CoA ligase [Alicyclobacillus dauci]